MASGVPAKDVGVTALEVRVLPIPQDHRTAVVQRNHQGLLPEGLLWKTLRSYLSRESVLVLTLRC